MSSSDLSYSNGFGDNGMSVDNVILPVTATEGLKPIQVTVMKETVFTVNQNTRLAGELIRSTASALYDLKANLVNKQWIAFLKSGALPIPEKQARDLTAAWEGWLRDSDVTDGDLVSIGTRTLARIKTLEPDAKKRIVKRIKSGEKLTLKDVSEIGGKVTANNKSEMVQNLKDENTYLKQENEMLKSKCNELQDQLSIAGIGK
jgi:hypothetical protein